jgi:hypothetical protein
MRVLPDFLHTLGHFQPHALQHQSVLVQGYAERQKPTIPVIQAQRHLGSVDYPQTAAELLARPRMNAIKFINPSVDTSR